MNSTLSDRSTLNGGIGSTHLNKLASSLNMPLMNWETYKRHEKEVGAAVESIAHDSCVQAAREERDLTIQNQDEMKKLLPSHLQDNFIFPDVNADVQSITKEHTVRVASSFDMGCITRGTGRTYDSLSGTGALIGHFSKKVISYITLNRKCRMCDMGHSPNDHDCRLNFQGSAKAMEPHAAVQLTNKNSILKEVKIEIGVLVADNDSSSIFAIRNASSHEVMKQSDKNHTSKGVVNMLYKIKNSYKELTAQSIKYLQRCFNFCISQNIGNDCNMATAIINIPEHCFNNHEKCGSWCKYETNQDTYKHSVINEGFKNQNLLLALREIFNTLAKKTSSFSAGASSNCNESLNSVIVSKAPKSRLYGTSSSGDIRVACAINQKNIGEQHVVHLAEKLTLSPGKYNEKKDKTELRNTKEVSEGTTYESDIGLRNLDYLSLPIHNIDSSIEPVVILFDLETGGLANNSDILQIAAKSENFTFSVYVKPTQRISEEASTVTGLRYDDGNLTLHGHTLETVPLLEAIIAFYEFLYLFVKKCVLTAHNCRFDYTRLLRAIKNTYMDKYYNSLILGFTDTLPLIKKCTNQRGKGKNTLAAVAATLNIDITQAHNALDDVIILDKVLKKFNITTDSIINNCARQCPSRFQPCGQKGRLYLRIKFEDKCKR
ncbi:uncharacterized protein [Prorops nasuta]|uniref:uncharacterized protein n=1 Tax=Prorops nasuta TaxID=863751 RepID=UPI0034CDB3E7